MPPAPCDRPGGWSNQTEEVRHGPAYDTAGRAVNGDQLRDELDDLESKVIDVAEQVIGAIAAIRARLTLMETAAELRDLVDLEGRDEEHHRWR